MPSSPVLVPKIKIKRPAARRSPVDRGTLRDLYAFGLVSVFRRSSVLRVWEPLRGTPAHSDRDAAR